MRRQCRGRQSCGIPCGSSWAWPWSACWARCSSLPMLTGRRAAAVVRPHGRRATARSPRPAPSPSTSAVVSGTAAADRRGRHRVSPSGDGGAPQVPQSRPGRSAATVPIAVPNITGPVTSSASTSPSAYRGRVRPGCTGRRSVIVWPSTVRRAQAAEAAPAAAASGVHRFVRHADLRADRPRGAGVRCGARGGGPPSLAGLVTQRR